MMHEWLSPLINLYPANDRPELNRIVSVGGTLIATNSHVSFMSPSEYPSGQYSLSGGPLPMWEPYPLDKLFEYFSKIGDMAEVPLSAIKGEMTETHKGVRFRTRVEVGPVTVDAKYWSLVETGVTKVRAGRLGDVSHIVAGEHKHGLFLIAGVLPDDK